MMYLLTSQWNWFADAVLLGLGMGWIAVVQHGQGMSMRHLQWAAGLVAVLALLALSRLVPGRPGYWLDLGLMMFAGYLFGCALGSVLRNRVLARHAAGRG